MRLRVTTLTENTATRAGTLAEHGLSMLLEVEDLCVLLDTGQTNTVVHPSGDKPVYCSDCFSALQRREGRW